MHSMSSLVSTTRSRDEDKELFLSNISMSMSTANDSFQSDSYRSAFSATKEDAQDLRIVQVSDVDSSQGQQQRNNSQPESECFFLTNVPASTENHHLAQ